MTGINQQDQLKKQVKTFENMIQQKGDKLTKEWDKRDAENRKKHQEKLYNMRNHNKSVEKKHQTSHRQTSVGTTIVQKVGLPSATESQIKILEQLDPDVEDYQFTRNENSYKN